MGERSTYSILVEVFFLKYIMNNSLVLREGHTLRKDEKLHRFIYSLSHLVSPLLLGKYSYRTAQAPELDFPYMVMSNHTTEADMIMLMRAFTDTGSKGRIHADNGKGDTEAYSQRKYYNDVS